MLLEAIVAATLLAVLLVVSLGVLGAMARERRAVEKRAIALQEAAGALERARAIPFEEITDGRLAEIRLSPSIEEVLPGAAIAWKVEPVETTPPARHIQAEVSWQSPVGGGMAPVRLNYWAYAHNRSSGGGP
jgi:hypothetical protein